MDSTYVNVILTRTQKGIFIQFYCNYYCCYLDFIMTDRNSNHFPFMYMNFDAFS